MQSYKCFICGIGRNSKGMRTPNHHGMCDQSDAAIMPANVFKTRRHDSKSLSQSSPPRH
jgi:hypothetical protein